MEEGLADPSTGSMRHLYARWRFEELFTDILFFHTNTW